MTNDLKAKSEELIDWAKNGTIPENKTQLGLQLVEEAKGMISHIQALQSALDERNRRVERLKQALLLNEQIENSNDFLNTNERMTSHGRASGLRMAFRIMTGEDVG